MAQVTTKISDITPIVRDGVVTADLKVGRAYHHVAFEITPGNAAALDSITGIRVIANGQELQRYTNGNQLDFINKFYGREAFTDAGQLYIDFDSHNLRLRLDEWFSALGTGIGFVDKQTGAAETRPIKSLVVEFDLAADSPITKIEGRALQNTINKVNEVVKSVKQYNENIPAGINTFNLNPPPAGIYKLVAFDWRERGGASAIDVVQMFIDNNIIFDRNPSINDSEQENGYRVPQTDWFMIDPTENGYGSEGLVTTLPSGRDVNDWLIQVRTTADAVAGNLTYAGISLMTPSW